MPTMMTDPAATGRVLQNSDSWLQKLAGKVATLGGLDPSDAAGTLDVPAVPGLPPVTGPAMKLAAMLAGKLAGSGMAAPAIALLKKPLQTVGRKARATAIRDRILPPTKPGITDEVREAAQTAFEKAPITADHLEDAALPKLSMGYGAAVSPTRADFSPVDGRSLALLLNRSLAHADPELIAPTIVHELTHVGQQLMDRSAGKRLLGTTGSGIVDQTRAIRQLMKQRGWGDIDPNNLYQIQQIGGIKGPADGFAQAMYGTMNNLRGYADNPYEVGARIAEHNHALRNADDFLPGMNARALELAKREAVRPGASDMAFRSLANSSARNAMTRGQRIDFNNPDDLADSLYLFDLGGGDPNVNRYFSLQGHPVDTPDLINLEQQRAAQQFLQQLLGILP